MVEKRYRTGGDRDTDNKRSLVLIGGSDGQSR